MRIATHTIYDLGVFNMNNRQSDLFKLQNQLSTGRKVLTPSDDPVASARSLDLIQSSSQNAQYITNAQSATGALGLSEANLQQIVRTLQDIQTLAVQSGDATLSSSEKKIIATNVASKYQELISLANTTDGNGQYLYSGYQGGTKPFNELAYGNVRYDGDQGQRSTQISPSRDIAVSDSGADLFVKIKNGNGVFAASMGQPDLPRTVVVGDSGPIQFSRDPAGGYVNSGYRVDWDAASGNYTITRTVDNQTSVQAPASLVPPGVNALGMVITATGNPPTKATATATFDGTLAASQGTGVVSPGVVTDPLKWADRNNTGLYRIAFHSVPDPQQPAKQLLSYDIINNDTTSANYNRSMIDGWDYKTATDPAGLATRTDSATRPNSYPRVYTPGGDIVLAALPGESNPLIAGWDFGAKVNVTGAPGDGDSFSINPSRDYDVFSTIGDFTAALNAYADNSVSAATFQNRLNTALANLDNTLSVVVTVQANVGSRWKEADSTQSTNKDLNLQLTQSISGLTDLDYSRAISDFTQTQTYLDAARKTFASVQSLSLFQYIQG
ncbi:flagellar hook-associated protein FlgL [Chitinimonas sp.]|uniref:flagellar hook-associated protein FlgL n=1 Tax=Chitinimonas sp. TaxID=1934313 RepID=UPI0035B33F06